MDHRPARVYDSSARARNPMLISTFAEPIDAEYFDGMNLYLYEKGSPVASLDPHGQATVSAIVNVCDRLYCDYFRPWVNTPGIFDFVRGYCNCRGFRDRADGLPASDIIDIIDHGSNCGGQWCGDGFMSTGDFSHLCGSINDGGLVNLEGCQTGCRGCYGPDLEDYAAACPGQCYEVCGCDGNVMWAEGGAHFCDGVWRCVKSGSCP